MSKKIQIRRLLDQLKGSGSEEGQPSSDAVQVRRAGRDDIPSIVTLMQTQVDQAQVTEWLFGKGLMVAQCGGSLAGVATWQAENLLSVTDEFYLSPGEAGSAAGRALLDAIEHEAGILMCEANVVLLPTFTCRIRTLLEEQGYEAKQFEELHRIWREVLGELVSDISPAQAAPGRDLMVKRLREKMIMLPV
jgi:hypothetical protein